MIRNTMYQLHISYKEVQGIEHENVSKSYSDTVV